MLMIFGRKTFPPFLQTARAKEASEEGQQWIDGGRSQSINSDRQVEECGQS